MTDSILVDTNVLIYAVDADSRFHERAWALLSDAALRLFTTSKNISEFLVVLTRDQDARLSSVECLEIPDGLLRDIIVLYPNAMTLEVFRKLIRKYKPRGLWIHDLEIASIGIARGITAIDTRNTYDFEQISEVTVRNI